MDGALRILSVTGYWKPISWENTYKGRVYDFARIFLIPMPILIVIGQIMYVLVVAEDVDGMMVTLYLLPSAISACCKGINMMIWRREVKELLKKLSLPFAMPMNAEERDIAGKFDNTIDHVYSVYFWICEAMVVFGTIGALLEENKMPIEVWFPYDHTSSRVVYCISFVWNLIGGICVAQLAIGSDVILNGFLISVICQMDLLRHRLVNLPRYSAEDGDTILNVEARVRKEKNLLKQCIQHHVFIYEFTDKFVSIFRLFIWSQWISNSTVTSISVYTLAHDLSNADALSLDFCLKINNMFAVLMQLFLFCWFSEQINIQSQELGVTILSSDWTALDIKSVRKFLIISLRTTRPIVISSGYFFTFSLESFKAILKVSYTAVNVLRESSA